MVFRYKIGLNHTTFVDCCQVKTSEGSSVLLGWVDASPFYPDILHCYSRNYIRVLILDEDLQASDGNTPPPPIQFDCMRKINVHIVI